MQSSGNDAFSLSKISECLPPNEQTEFNPFFDYSSSTPVVELFSYPQMPELAPNSKPATPVPLASSGTFPVLGALTSSAELQTIYAGAVIASFDPNKQEQALVKLFDVKTPMPSAPQLGL